MCPRLLVLDFAGVCTPSHGEYLVEQLDVVRPEAEAVTAAAQAAGITVVILSNEIDRAWVDDIALLGAVDHVIACTDNGILKPDRRAFQRALLLTDTAAEHALVVDDEPDNIAGATAAGIDALLFDVDDPAGSWAEISRRLELPGICGELPT